MEHITIISQEAITSGLWWPPLIPATIGILFFMSSFFILAFCRNCLKRAYDVSMKLMLHAIVCFGLFIITAEICNFFFPVETGRYKYEGTLDPNMTIVEFEEFHQQYSNVRFEDGVWKWEEKE